MSRADEIVSARLQQQAEVEKRAKIEALARQKAHYSAQIRADLPGLLDSLAARDYPDAVLLSVSIGKTMFGNPKRPVAKAAWKVYKEDTSHSDRYRGLDGHWYVLSEGLFVLPGYLNSLKAVPFERLAEFFGESTRQQEICVEVLRGVTEGIKKLRALYD